MALARIPYTNMIIAYELVDVDDDCALKKHATHVRFDMDTGQYKDYDYN